MSSIVWTKCKECGGQILNFSTAPVQITCDECRELATNDGQVDSKERVRCPECGHLHNIIQMACDGMYKCMEDGTHSIECEECGADFEFTTYVSYNFTSEPRRSSDREVKDSEPADDSEFLFAESHEN